MVLLQECEGKTPEEIKQGAYFRCFGNVGLARLISRTQSLIIKNGYELENLVDELTERIQVDDLDEFLSHQIMHHGVRIVKKSVIRQSNDIEGHGIEPDFIVFRRQGQTQSCYIIELKDGHEFDTKSSAKEHANLHTFLSKNAMALQYFHSYCKVVGFNAESREDIRTGFKNKIAIEQAMTGAEFCGLLELDYGEIRHQRALDRQSNVDHFIDELLSIDMVRDRITERLRLG